MAIGSSIEPIRRDWLQRAQGHLGDLLQRAGASIMPPERGPDEGLGLGAALGNAAVAAGDFVREGLGTQWQNAGGLLEHNSYGFPVARMDKGLMSLQVDPRVADVAFTAADAVALGPVAKHVGKAAVGAVKQSAREFVEDSAKSASRIIAGPKARTADQVKLARAKELDDRNRIADGATKEQRAKWERQKRDYIYAETGWWKGKDGNWRFEIDDSQAALSAQLAASGKVADRPLQVSLEHDALAAAYPDIMQGVKTTAEVRPGETRGGTFSPNNNTISIHSQDQGSLLKGLLHEGNHAVADVEGFAPGGSPRDAAGIVERALSNDPFVEPKFSLDQASLLTQYAQNPQLAYRALAGEADSRAVELRSGLSPRQRKSRPLYKDYDIPESKQIVLTGDRDRPVQMMAADGTKGSNLSPVVYRGEHGQGDDLLTRRGSYTFTDSKDVARTYADHPNDRTLGHGGNPRVIEAQLQIDNPVFVNRDDPFVDLSTISEKLGPDEAQRFARKHAQHIQETDNWRENFASQYDNVDDLLSDRPEAVNELYLDAYRLLDDQEFTKTAKAKGFDGAIHVGNSESADALEYRVFDKSQVRRVDAPTPSSLLPETKTAPKEITLNIGLATNDGAGITDKQAIKELQKLGVKVKVSEVRGSNTEPTLIATLDKPLTPEQADQLSVKLRQEAIVQRVDGEGALYGPAKEKWGPFNPEYFLDPTPPPKKRRRSAGQTVDNPQRTEYAGIYGDPVEVAKLAESRVAPESPWLAKLFGTTRAEMAKTAERSGNAQASLPGVTKGGAGAESATNVMTRANATRLRNLLDAGREHAPGLTEGMTGWYVMDPLYQKMLAELGDPALAKQAFERFNTLTGMASPGSDVMTEINRGTGADMLLERGQFDDFMRYGGMGEPLRGPNFPDHVRPIKGHPYHSTAQAPAMEKFVRTGRVQMQSPKVPTYIEASSVPEVGFQTDTLVGDSHWSRGVGLADVRTSKDPHGSISNSEIKLLGPWWKDKVAEPSGYRAVPAQANLWGLLGPQTGVDTPLGAPKLELLAESIVKTATREGIAPEEALRRLIRKQGQAGSVDPGLLAALSAAVAAAAAAAPSLLNQEPK